MRAASFAVVALCALAPFAVGRAQTLDGAIDMHAHAAPDGTPRKLDALEQGALLELVHGPLTEARLLGLEP